MSEPRKISHNQVEMVVHTLNKMAVVVACLASDDEQDAAKKADEVHAGIEEIAMTVKGNRSLDVEVQIADMRILVISSLKYLVSILENANP